MHGSVIELVEDVRVASVETINNGELVLNSTTIELRTTTTKGTTTDLAMTRWEQAWNR